MSLLAHELVAHRSWAGVATHPTEDPRARCLSRLARAVSSRSLEKLCLNKVEQQRRIPAINFRPLRNCVLCILHMCFSTNVNRADCVNIQTTHTQTHTHTHAKQNINERQIFRKDWLGEIVFKS